MKFIESSDGTIKIVELDPTRVHWVIVEPGSLLVGDFEKLVEAMKNKTDSIVIQKRRGTSLEIIEAPEDGMVVQI